MSGLLNAFLGSAMTYPEYQALIAARATNGSVSFTADLPTGKYRTTAGAPSGGNMFGSPWQSLVGLEGWAKTDRAIRHAAPSEAIFNALVSVGTEIYFETVYSDLSDLTGLNRNGYSSSGGLNLPAGTMVEMLYWHDDKPWRMNPYAGTGPTIFTP